MNLMQFISILGDKKLMPQGQQRSDLAEFANALLAARATLSEADKTWLIAKLKQISRLPIRFKVALANHLLYWFTDDSRYLSEGIKSSLLDESGIEGRVANMNALGASVFNASRGANVIRSEFSRSRYRSYYEDTVALIDKLIRNRGVHIKETFDPSNRVVILIQQFLAPPHAPTKDALEFAFALSSHHSKEVLIVSTCEFSGQPNGSVLPLFLGNVVKSYSNQASIDYKGKTFQYFQPQQGRFFADSIPSIVQTIETFDPAMILVVGARNLLAELFVPRAFVLFYPTTSNLPMLTRPHFFMWRDLTANEIELLQAEGIKDCYLFSQHPGFEAPTRKTTLDRASFNIPYDAFVFIVVGMRLDADIKPDFLEMLEAVVSNERAHVAFAGHFSEYIQVVESRPKLKHRCSLLGFQEDIMAVFEISDCYLNPKRTGGGSAVVYALAAGLPSLSCPVGDGFEAVRNFPPVPDYPTMAKTCLSLISDATLLQSYQQLALQEASRLCSRRPLVDKIEASYQAFFAAQSTRA